MSLRLVALLLGIAALATLLLSGPGTRLGLWDWRTGLGLFRYAAYLGIAAAVVSAVLLLVPRVRKGHTLALVAALALGLAALVPPLAFQRQARSVPPINDITTAPEDPSSRRAQLQREAYPDIQAVMLPQPPEAAFARAAAAAEEMGWEIVSRDAAARRLEAVDTTLWFGFRDDVTIWVSPAPQGSRIDIRSRSRVGRGDVGTNAARIRSWRAALLE